MEKHETGGAFAPEQLQSILKSEEGRRLMQLLNRDGGAALRRAAEAARKGDYEAARQIVEPMMQSQEAEKLVSEINRKQGKGHG